VISEPIDFHKLPEDLVNLASRQLRDGESTLTEGITNLVCNARRSGNINLGDNLYRVLCERRFMGYGTSAINGQPANAWIRMAGELGNDDKVLADRRSSLRTDANGVSRSPSYPRVIVNCAGQTDPLIFVQIGISELPQTNTNLKSEARVRMVLEHVINKAPEEARIAAKKLNEGVGCSVCLDAIFFSQSSYSFKSCEHIRVIRVGPP
jgi:hypothetical protein